MTRPRQIEPQHVFAVITSLFEDAAGAVSYGMGPQGTVKDRLRLVRRARTMVRRIERMLDLVERIDRDT